MCLLKSKAHLLANTCSPTPVHTCLPTPVHTCLPTLAHRLLARTCLPTPVMDCKLTQRGLEVSQSQLVSVFGLKTVRSLLNKFTITYPAPMGTYRIRKEIYGKVKGDKDTILLPRFAVSRLLSAKFIASASDIVDAIPRGVDIDVDFLGSPTHNQALTADYMMREWFPSHGGGCTLDMQPGEGKTFLAMYLISLVKKKTLIVVPNTYLLKQWVKCLEQYTTASIGVYYGEEKKDGDVVVGIVNSLVMDHITFKTKTELPPAYLKNGKPSRRKLFQVDTITLPVMKYFESFGMVVLDESHTYATDAFRKLYNTAQCKYMVGLSATPNEREHGLDRISHYNIGEVLDAKQIDGYQINAVAMQSTVELVNYSGPDHLTQAHTLPNSNTVFVPRMIEDLQADDHRNTLIVSKTIDLMIKGLNVFVFTERRAHAEVLACMLADMTNTPHSRIQHGDDSVVVMYGGVCDGVINTAKDCASVVFTTYAYSSTGVSIDRMTGLVLASPRRSKATQVVGRIFRQNKSFNDVHRCIVDVVDKRSLLCAQLRARMPAYRARNSDISSTAIHWKDITPFQRLTNTDTNHMSLNTSSSSDISSESGDDIGTDCEELEREIINMCAT